MKMKGSKYITCVCTHTGTRVPGKRWYHRCTQSYCYPGTVYYKYILLLYFKTQVHVEKNILLLLLCYKLQA